MPRNLINNYTFYKIVCLDNAVDLSYVGSTADFNKRKSEHKQNCNNEKRPAHNYKVYRTIRDNGGWSNFKIIEIAKQDQLTLREAEQIEERYRVELNAEMNDRRCFLTEEEKQDYWKKWRENNPEYNKEWYENNKEQCKEKSKEWRENNKEYNKEQCKEWRKNNPDYDKKHYQKNKEKLKAKRETPEFKAKQAIAHKKYYDKKKLEKQQLKNNKE